MEKRPQTRYKKLGTKKQKLYAKIQIRSQRPQNQKLGLETRDRPSTDSKLETRTHKLKTE